MKHFVAAGLVAFSTLIGSVASAATVGITEGTRPLVKNTTAVATTDVPPDAENAYNLDALGTLGPDSFEIYGRIVDSIDNFAFGFTALSQFDVSFIFGGYTLANDTFVADSGFVSQGAAEKTATFSLLDADNNFSVVSSFTTTTDVTSGNALLFSAGAGNYVLQIDGSGTNATGPGIGLYDLRISEVPLPASAVLLLFGMAGLGAMARKRG